jgi:hypothetical protein
MKHSSYRLKDGLIGMNLQGHLAVLDDLLNAEVFSQEERRSMLMDHEGLTAMAEFFLRYPALVEDQDGRSYLPLRDGRRAYDLDEFLDFLKHDRHHLRRLIALVRKALFARFIEDATAFWREAA